MFFLSVLFFFSIFSAEIRIASLDPAASEVLTALNLNSFIVASDDLSQKLSLVSNNTIVAKGQKIDYEKLLSLKVSHVVAHDLGFVSLQPQLQKMNIPLLLLKNQRLRDIIENIELLQKTFATATPHLSSELQQTIQKMVQQNKKSKTYLLQVDFAPNYVVGTDTFITDGLSACGFKNIIAQKGYPIWNTEQILKHPSDIVFIMSDLLQKQDKKTIYSYWQKWSPKSQVIILPADIFSRLTPRFVKNLQQICSKESQNK